MSVLNSIIQAILQSISEIFPISESAHSAMFHDFAARGGDSCAVITGVIHIGIALGIVAAMYKLFLKLGNEFFFTFGDVFKKRLKGSSLKPKRKFMYMTLLSFAPLVLWLIPLGRQGFLMSFLRKNAYNGTLLDDGIFLAISGALLLLASRQLMLSKNDKNIGVPFALAVGFSLLFLSTVSGFALIGGVFSLLMLLGVTKKLALRYAFVVSVPVYIILGIVEICTGAAPAGVVSIILGIIISALVTFICVKVLRWVINNEKLKYFAIYDLGVGAIAAVIGIFELALR